MNEDNNVVSESTTDYNQNKDRVYLSSKPSIYTYYNSLKGKFIKNILLELNLTDNIFEISSIDMLKDIRKKVSEKEKFTSSHNRNACAISKLIAYLEKGYSSKEFLHDALLAKK